jgi:hypothetical protein
MRAGNINNLFYSPFDPGLVINRQRKRYSVDRVRSIAVFLAVLAVVSAKNVLANVATGKWT